MKIATLLFGVFLVLSTENCTFAQMINGGFEVFNDDEDGDNQWDDWYPHSIEYAAGGWHNSPITQSGENSCDHIHPQSPIVSGTPRTGVGCAGFGAVGNGFNEFFYGTSDPLIAGQQYSVSFWIRKDYLTLDDAVIGASVAETPAVITWTPFNSTQAPQVTVQDVGLTYQEVKFCFTPQNSVAHYITFGALLGYGGMSNVYYFIDDVSITAIPQGAPLPIANLTIPQNTYCTGDAVVVNGSPTINEDGYTWEVYQLDQGQEIFEYSSGLQTGQAATFDVSAVLGFVSPGECYRVYLKADGLCPDETFVDFCYVDPDIDFIYDGSAVCENTTVSLSVTGDNGWTYTWSSGQSGVGLKTVNVTPSIGNETFTVDVTTPEGCTFSESITLTVHSQNNLAPWMDGVNGTGDYTFYVSSGVAYPPFTFVSNFYNDNSSELLTYTAGPTNIPVQTAYSISLPNQFTSGGQMTFSINTSWTIGLLDTPPGTYYFTILVTDDNACNALPAEFTFNIVVGCDHCPLCVTYEDRTSNGFPLPDETKAIECIEAGLNLPVETGTASVLFQAGNTITLGANFSAGANFQAVIEPTTCITDCEDCCTDWEGFTYDPPTNYMSVVDGIPETDIWQLTDIYHPYCAFNAMGYKLTIDNDQGAAWPSDATGDVHFSEYYSNNCCAFQSPSPDNPITHSPIYWDGITTTIFGEETYWPQNTYWYTVTLYGCNGEEEYFYGFFEFISPGVGRISDTTRTDSEVSGQYHAADSLLKRRDQLNQTLTLQPNPSSELVTVVGIDVTATTKVQLFDATGKMLTGFIALENGTFNIAYLASGTYLVKVITEEFHIFRKIIKI